MFRDCHLKNLFQACACFATVLVGLSSLAQAIQEDDPVLPLEPKESLAEFETSDLFDVQMVLAEPKISQPVFFNFDERGRLWVMNYLQYPYPAGLKMVSRDVHWRAVYDKVPVAPPNHTRGADKITIHEDTNGDGVFDKSKTFIDGLNIATSFVRGRGGVWVLNPPYLLFYPDRNKDDVPDDDPVVHLEGFGLQDTHSCANSLRWGPDGWLYAAQGSTVTGNISRPGEKKVTRSLGQLIWRYHPERKIYEIFAEGGGNTFGVEIDSAGRIYSGHNGGDTRGFHYVQGGYYRKGFQKHGPLSNSFAFGFFPAMKHKKVARFVHNFVIYDSAKGPSEILGDLFGIEPLQGRVVRSKIISDGTTFRTVDEDHSLTSNDKWFRPVDIKVGPDGAIYVADFYEPFISHRDHFAGNIDKKRGRIVRLVPKSGQRQTFPEFDLTNSSAAEVLPFLSHPDKWFRQTALRRLYDLKEPSLLPILYEKFDNGENCLEMLWAINACGGFDKSFAIKAVRNEDAHVRTWATRLACDFVPFNDHVGMDSEVAKAINQLATVERDPIVRSQILSSIRRLPPEQAIPILKQFLRSSDEAKDQLDPHIPLLCWWAIEKHCTTSPENVLSMMHQNEWMWETELFKTTVAERMMRRFALAGTQADYEICLKLLQSAPTSASKSLGIGFEKAFEGRSMAGVPSELFTELSRRGKSSLAFQIRSGKQDAIAEAIKMMMDVDKTEVAELVDVIDAYASAPVNDGKPLLNLIRSDSQPVRTAALKAAGRFREEELGQIIVDNLHLFDTDNSLVATNILSGTPEWTSLLLSAIENDKVDPSHIEGSVVNKMRLHDDESLLLRLQAIWPNSTSLNTAEYKGQIQRISKLVSAKDDAGGQDQLDDAARPDPFRGKKIYNERCGKCHQMFGEGGNIGPDLTSYNRRDTLNLLINIVQPSAEIREGFENYKVLTLDGRIVVGFISDQNQHVVVVRQSDGQVSTIERTDIDEMAAQKTSLMPDGLLKDLDEQQLRDLFAFLRSSQPLNK